MRFRAKYYSGQRSSFSEIYLSANDLGLLSCEFNEFEPQAISSIKFSPRVGNSLRYLTLADGSKLETSDNDSIDELIRLYAIPNTGLAHRLEGSKRFIIIAVFGLVLGAYAFVTYAIPASSAYITNILPVALDNQLGGELLEQLDEIVFEPSVLDPARQDELTQRFAALTPNSSRDYKLQFRSSEILGANAFALPDAQIVFTDQLIALAENDAMIEGIMLHEIGHIVYRHSMQSVVRQAGVSIAVFALTGDVNSVAATLLILLPVFMIQSQYSRSFEWEADGYALEQMLARDIDTDAFADMMEKLSGGRNNETEESTSADQESTVRIADEEFEYFSSHPATRLRIERFRNAAANGIN